MGVRPTYQVRIAKPLNRSFTLGCEPVVFSPYIFRRNNKDYNERQLVCFSYIFSIGNQKGRVMNVNVYEPRPTPVYYVYQPRRKYGFFRFMLDVFMVFLTGGLWIIWIFVREMRNR